MKRQFIATSSGKPSDRIRVLLVVPQHSLAAEALTNWLRSIAIVHEAQLVIAGTQRQSFPIPVTEDSIFLLLLTAQTGGQTEFVRRIFRQCASPRFIFALSDQAGHLCQDQLPLHTAGYVLLSEPLQELMTALLRVGSHKSYVSEGVRLLRAGVRDVPESLRHLHQRDQMIAFDLARGFTLRRIARDYSVAYKTADSLRTRIYRELGVKNRGELTQLALREGWLQPEPLFENDGGLKLPVDCRSRTDQTREFPQPAQDPQRYASQEIQNRPAPSKAQQISEF